MFSIVKIVMLYILNKSSEWVGQGKDHNNSFQSTWN